MVLIPSLSSMLLVLGIALVITVVASAAVGMLLALVTEHRRRHDVAHPSIPAQRADHRAPATKELASTSRS